MSRIDVVKLAREAGAVEYPAGFINVYTQDECVLIHLDSLERFAALIVEECAKVCEERPTGTAFDNGLACAAAIRQLVKESK